MNLHAQVGAVRPVTLRIIAASAAVTLILLLAAFQDGRVGATSSVGPMLPDASASSEIRGPSDVSSVMLRSFVTVPTTPASTVQAHVAVSAPVASFDSGSPAIVRVVSVTAVITLQQIELAVLTVLQEVDVAGSEPIVLQAGGVHLGNALYFAHTLLREPAEPSSENPLEYRVTVTPSHNQSWLDVDEHGDVSVVVDLID